MMKFRSKCLTYCFAYPKSELQKLLPAGTPLTTYVRRMMSVSIISEERIKPNLPTPHHLKIYKLSAFDQITPNFYVPATIFFPNDSEVDKSCVISTRFETLKQSLSRTLTNFYPFAGKVMKDDYLFVDCNDEGVHYVEARVESDLSNFLSNPINVNLLNQLFPYDLESLKIMDKTDVMMIQVNAFCCGGISISIFMSHQVMDAHSLLTFLGAWAATARDTSEICPDFNTAPSLLPQIPSPLPTYNIFASPNKFVTRRFVFEQSSLVSLKEKVAASTKVQYPSRVEAVSTLIWKCVTKAGHKVRLDSQETQVLMVPVNLRTKKSKIPLPKFSLGNIFWNAFAVCSTDDAEKSCTVENIQKCLGKIDAKFVDEITGENRHLKFLENFKECGQSLKLIKMDLSNVVTLSSVCNSGFYGVDFGWGTPVWIYFRAPFSANLVILSDTRFGIGIEAMVHLTEKEMALFASDPELLEHALVDPSPLN